MALALVQSGDSASESSGSPGTVLQGNTTIGNCVALCIVLGSSPGPVANVTSPIGTFTRIGGVIIGSGYQVEWWVCLSATGTAKTVTAYTQSSYNWQAQATEWSGGIVSASLGQSASTFTSLMTIVQSVIGGNVALVGGAVPVNFTTYPTSPWTDYNTGAFKNNAALGFGSADVAWQVASTTGNVTASWSLNAASQWVAVGIILTGGTPAPPTLQTPTNPSYQDVSSGLAFLGLYNAAASDAQDAYAMRIKVSSGSYNYWNAGTNALQATIVWNAISTLPGGSFGPTLPNTAISDGNVYNWSLASRDVVSGLTGAFATDFTFTARSAPTVTGVLPTGAISGTSMPGISWTESFTGGGAQIAYQVIIESGTYSTVPGSGTQAWASGIIPGTDLSTAPSVPLISGTTYRVFVQITATGGQTSAWNYSTFTLTVDVPAAPTVTATASTDPTTGCPMIDLQVQAHDNLLSADDSSFESSIGTWVPGAGTSIARSNAASEDGSYSLAITSL